MINELMPSFIEELNNTLGSEHVKFYPGVGYRHLMVVKGYDFPDLQLQPPHDNISGEIEKLLPRGKNADVLIDLIKKSEKIFELYHDVFTSISIGDDVFKEIAWCYPY